MIKVAVAGGFDPYHKGHREHLLKAKELGDKLYVILARDDQLIMKKGWRLLPLLDRYYQLLDLKFVDFVVINIDRNVTTCSKTLELIKPNIFAKGGDRTPDNMPQCEIDICILLGIVIQYNIGSFQGSSTKYVEAVVDTINQRRKHVKNNW